MSVASEQKQDTGNVSLASIDAKTAGLASGGALTKPVASGSVDIGQDLSLSDTAAHTFASSAVAKYGIMVSCPIANTKPVYVALGSGVTTSTGVELQPGDREFFWGILNSNLISAITGAATQHVRALAI